jgi:hypothetical protein
LKKLTKLQAQIQYYEARKDDEGAAKVRAEIQEIEAAAEARASA